MNEQELQQLERRLRASAADHRPAAPDVLVRFIDTVPVDHAASRPRSLWFGLPEVRKGFLTLAAAALVVVAVVGGMGFGAFRSGQIPADSGGASLDASLPAATGSPSEGAESPTPSVLPTPLESPTSSETLPTSSPTSTYTPTPSPSTKLTPSPSPGLGECSVLPIVKLAPNLDGVGNWTEQAFVWAEENIWGYGACSFTGWATGPHVAVLAVCDQAQTLTVGLYTPLDSHDMDPPVVATFSVLCPIGTTTVVYDATIAALADHNVQIKVSGPTVKGDGTAKGHYEFLVQTTSES
jgi:hypothetical protein